MKLTNADEFQNRASQLLNAGITEEEVKQELRDLAKYPRFYDFDHYTYCDAKGVFRANDLTAPNSKNFFDILHPVTNKPCKKSTRGWAYSETGINDLITNQMIYFGKDETTVPQLKCYLQDTLMQTPRGIVFFDSQNDTKWIKRNNLCFDFPKPVDFIKHLLSLLPSSNDSIILDFFSGSATTAHAVMQLNAEDNGNRKFIMVQLPEETAEKSEAFKTGYKNICEIGKERIRRAGAKIKEENPLTTQDLDTGFRVLKVDSSNTKEDIYKRPLAITQANLFEQEDNIKEERTPEDLLFQAMLQLGVLLSHKIEESTIAGKKVFTVNYPSLIACFDEEITEEVITEIAKRKPFYFVMRDSSMASDSLAVNFDNIFKQYSDETKRLVL